jgi:hypothetical protein
VPGQVVTFILDYILNANIKKTLIYEQTAEHLSNPSITPEKGAIDTTHTKMQVPIKNIFLLSIPYSILIKTIWVPHGGCTNILVPEKSGTAASELLLHGDGEIEKLGAGREGGATHQQIRPPLLNRSPLHSSSPSDERRRRPEVEGKARKGLVAEVVERSGVKWAGLLRPNKWVGLQAFQPTKSSLLDENRPWTITRRTRSCLVGSNVTYFY